MSQGSDSSQEILREIDECIEVNNKLLEFSERKETLIRPDNMEPQQEFAHAQQFWTLEESNILNEHFDFYQQMIQVIKIAQISGPQKLPKRPKRKLEDLFKEKSSKVKKARKEMTPEGLHNYLQQHIQDMSKTISREAFLFKVGEDVSIDQAIGQLKNVYKHLCRQNAQSMYFNCDFGIFLNEVYKWFQKQKIQGLINYIMASLVEYSYQHFSLSR